jgi:hypothetical protein
MPTVLWRGWSHGLEWFDFSACCVEARRSSRLNRQRPFSPTDLAGTSNEVGILKIMQVFELTRALTCGARAGNPDEQCVLEACDVDLGVGDLEGFHRSGVSLHRRLDRGCIGQRLGRGSVAKEWTPLVGVLLRLVGGLGGRRRPRLARRRLHQGGRRSGGCPAVPIRAVRGDGWRRLEPHLRGR